MKARAVNGAWIEIKNRKPYGGMTRIERFWKSVKSGSPEECWLWTGNKDQSGYGRVWWINRLESAHRVAYLLSKGSVDLGLCVLHRCDTPNCCNPDHLFIGSHADNMRDMRIKRRNGHGANYRRLSTEEKIAIRELFKTGKFSQVKIAAMFQVHQGTVCKVVN